MKRGMTMTPAQKIIRRISALRELTRRLALAGYRAGLHSHDPNQLPSVNHVAEPPAVYSVRARNKKRCA